MKAIVGFAAFTAFAVITGAAIGLTSTPAADGAPSSATNEVVARPALQTFETLAWSEIVEAGGSTLRLSKRVAGLNGRRVRLVGSMAKLELPPRGGFYLTARPMLGDESGAGTGDLPIDAVLVLASSAEAESVVPMPLDGPVVVTGTLEVGPREDSEGRAAWLRLRLDPQVSH